MVHTLLKSIPYVSGVNPIVVGLAGLVLLAYVIWFAWTLLFYRPREYEVLLRTQQGRGGGRWGNERGRSRR